jgi:glycosyltransferase involved in cell wall biosynthesis
MSPPPRVSVIIPTNNRPELLENALDSVVAQIFPDWEVIVLDDGSQSPVHQHLAERHVQRVQIVRHDQPRGGPAAKNSGAAMANGEIVAFLDDDDLYAPAYLERAVAVLDKYPEVQLVFMGVSWFGENAKWGEQAYRQAMQKTLEQAKGWELEPGVIRFGESLVAALLNSVPMAFQRPVMRFGTWERIGGYREGCLLWDCDWAIRAALEIPAALVIDGLYLQRAQGQGYSSKPDRRLDHLLSVIEIHETLWERGRADAVLSARTELFRQAAAKFWFNLAYFYYNGGLLSEALSAWCESERRAVNFARAKLLVRILLAAMRLRRSMQGRS